MMDSLHISKWIGHKMFDGLMVFCRVDPWESYQDTWQTTCSVLEHHRDLMKVSLNFVLNAVRFLLVLNLKVINWAVPLQRVTGCILSNVNTPSTTPVIGQPQNGTSPIYQNTANKSVASKWGDICLVLWRTGPWFHDWLMPLFLQLSFGERWAKTWAKYVVFAHTWIVLPLLVSC